MDQQPKIPTLKDAQKPQVKIKGMGAGLTLFDRLKQFKKKDLAFILAGLGTLFMAPLAEHFMMAPENGDASLQQGWGKGGTGSNLFGSGSSPYESGNNNIASGGAIGGSGDIITPLNVRDPSALVMGPGGTQQPPAGSVAPPTAPAPARSETDYKDALAGAASRAASAAVKKAPLPVPKVSISNSGLRGLGVAGGGSSASGGLLPVGPAAGSTGGGGGSGLNLVRATPNFKGVAGGRSPTGGTGLDNTKRAGANAGDAFNRAGSAAAGLNAAASEAIPTAGQGYGGGGHGGSGANDKPGSGTGPGGSKSVGESLAFIEAKERMMEKLKLEFEKRKLKDPELLLYGIRNDVLKASAAKVGEGLTTWGMCKGLSMGCPAPDSDYMCMGIPTKESDIPKCDEGGGKDQSKAKTSACYWPQVDGSLTSNKDGTGAKCIPSGKKGDAAKNPSAETGASTGGDRLAYGGQLAAGGPAVGEGLDKGCAGVSALATQGAATNAAANVQAASVDKDEIPYYVEMKTRGAKVALARSLLNGGGAATACGNAPAVAGSKTAVLLQADALKYLQDQLPLMNGLVAKAGDGKKDIEAGRSSVAAAASLVSTAAQQIKDARTNLENAGTFAPYPKNANTTEAKDATRKLTDAKDQLVKDADLIASAQTKLEAALKKAQATIGTTEPAAEGTLGQVLTQNQAFLDLKSTLDTKKAEFATSTKIEADKELWPKAAIPDPKELTPGGTETPERVAALAVTDEKSAAKSIDAVCKKIGGCTATPAAGSNQTAAPNATSDQTTKADAPPYSEVSALFQPATDSVGTMRQGQSSAISGLSSDLTALGAKK